MKKKEVKTVNTKTMGVNMSKAMFSEIEKKARSEKISKSLYCKKVLQYWIESGNSLPKEV